MSKDLYIAALEDLMAEGLTYEQASDRAYDVMRDRLLDHADALKQRAKEEGRWPPKPKERP
jgi:hypothetical protein